MLGLLDRLHAFVELQRFRQRCRSRVANAIVIETARIGITTNIKVQGIVLDQKRGCAHREREREEKEIAALEGRRRER